MIDVQILSVAGIGKSNEDYVKCSEIAPKVSLIIVCDGMGGLANGQAASSLVTSCLVDYVSVYYRTQSHKQVIVNAILYANEELAKECIRLKSKMGASVALILIVGDYFYYSWLGDVRVYHRQNGIIELLTKDHLAIEGNHTFLSRSVNGKELRYIPEVEQRILCMGDEILIATDGYYLHNGIGSPLELSEVADDDATIVCIKQMP